MLCFERFIYYEDCNLSGENVLPVLYASKKYMVPALTERCAEFLQDSLHVDNACVIYEQCLYFDEVAILDKCRSFIETRTREVFDSDSFKDLSRMYHSLTVCTVTVDAYRAFLRWKIFIAYIFKPLDKSYGLIAVVFLVQRNLLVLVFV